MICPHHGYDMVAYMSVLFEDSKVCDHFVDVFYKCPDRECQQRRVARYKDEYVFCNIHTAEDVRDYNPDMAHRKAKFTFADDEV